MEAGLKMFAHNGWFGKIMALVFVWLFLALQAIQAQTEEPKYAQYLVSYLGIPILDTYQEMSKDANFTTVVYINQIKPFWATFQNVRNRYSATFTSVGFTPIRDEKEILEGNFTQSLSGQYSEEMNKVIYSNRQKSPWNKRAYSVLSAVHFLEQESRNLKYPHTMDIVIEGEIWEAYVTHKGAETLEIMNERVNTKHVNIVMRPRGGQMILSRTDILMDFLSTAGSRLDLWITDNQQIVRVQVGEFPKAVVLELVKNGVNAMETD